MSTANCYVDFWENDNKDGRHRRFSGPTSVSNLSKYYYENEKENFSNEMDDSISSLATGSQSWVTVYSDNDYQGKQLTVGPGQTVNKLSGTNPVMENDIASFKLFDARPVNTQNVLNNLLTLYPGSVKTTCGIPAEQCIEWYAADSHYRLYYPSIQQSGSTVNFSMRLDHILGAGGDDHATVTFAMDTSGNFVQKITITYDMSSGPVQVPQWMLNFIDDGIDAVADEAIAFLDGAEIVLTAGVGTELIIPTDILILAGAEVLTIAVNHVNEVIDKLFNLSDNGGSMYFPAIVIHAVARLAYSYMQELYGSNGGTLTFNQGTFQQYFNTEWNDDNKSNPDILFSNGGSDYRCYYPDNTAGFCKAGYVSSAKMDAINNNDKDDYLSLLTTFDPAGKLFSVQGTIDIYGAPDDNDDADSYVAPSSGTIAYDKNGNVIQITKNGIVPMNGYTNVADAYKATMQSALDNVQYVDHGDFSTALKNIVNASYEVVKAIDSSVQ
jgi:hypothetical protein